jgi:hypothetical protein
MEDHGKMDQRISFRVDYVVPLSANETYYSTNKQRNVSTDNFFIPNITKPIQQNIETVYNQNYMQLVSTEQRQETYPYHTNKPIAMRTQNKHNNYWIVMQEEGVLPRCEACGIFPHSVKRNTQTVGAVQKMDNS